MTVKKLTATLLITALLLCIASAPCHALSYSDDIFYEDTQNTDTEAEDTFLPEDSDTSADIGEEQTDPEGDKPQEEEPSQEDEEQQEAAVPDDNDIVATITLFFKPRNIISGHSWVYFENLSDTDLTIGIYTLSPGEGVSVGTLAVTVSDGVGVYYNVESYAQTRGSIGNYRTITRDLTLRQLNKACKTIKNYPNMWDPILMNCVFFSLIVWDSATGMLLVPLILPVFAFLEMLLCGTKKNTPAMKEVSPEEVYRQKGTGKRARLTDVSKGTLNCSF